MLPADQRHRLFLLGSGEFEPWVDDGDRHAVDRGHGDGTVLVLPTASAADGEATFQEWGRKGLAHYKSLHIPARLCPLARREDAFDASIVEMLGECSMFFFSGGNPAYLAATVRGTPFETALRAALDRGAVFGGCSAGAMLAGVRTTERLDGSLDPDEWRPALELFPNAVFGPHWDGIEEKPAQILEHVVPRGGWLVTIDERTAVFVEGTRLQVFGEGRVTTRRDGGILELAAGAHEADVISLPVGSKITPASTQND